MNSLPAVVYHADWGTAFQKRWFSMAVRTRAGYEAYGPALVNDHTAFISRVKGETGTGGSAIVGFDFPIGIPSRYAVLIDAAAFKPFLLQLGDGAFPDFYRISGDAADISPFRPFYPYKPGGTRHGHLVSGLGMTCFNDLRRQCELGYDGRRAACPLFWTLGPNQVGRAAILGWRDVLVPALRDPGTRLWPFDGPVDSLLMPGHVVIAETYPAECYRWFFQGQRPVVKTSLESRERVGPALLNWAQSASVTLDPELRQTIEDGFPKGDDAFDAVVGLFGMLEVLLNRRSSGEPNKESVMQVEGWIFGQAPIPVNPQFESSAARR